MTLLLSKEYHKELNPGVYCVKTSMLKEPGPHLFIASEKWDEIRVELSEELPVENIGRLSLVCDNIKVKRVPDMDTYIDALIVLFPSKGGALRKCKITGSPVIDVIKEFIYE